MSWFLLPYSVVPVIAKHRRILGEAIRVRRNELKFSQEKLAEKADLTPGYVSELERGNETISVDRLVRIADALGLTVTDLVNGF